ncbi:MAG: hypothetical protein ABW133_24500 [Polyangiaceae bacterium]
MPEVDGARSATSHHENVTWCSPDAPPGAMIGDLRRHRAIGWRGAVAREEAARWSAAIVAARSLWHADFGGEQFTLGRAFYTHLEEERLAEYFRDARAADAEVEGTAPGLQARMRAIVAQITGGRVTSRSDFCGAGVHIFPPGEKVARAGGVVHFDLEGLPKSFLASGRQAITVVLTLQDVAGGGLRFWNARYDPAANTDEARVASRARARDAEVRRAARGDVIVFDSFVLHQIEPFDGDAPRLSATLHAMQIAKDTWETWF